MSENGEYVDGSLFYYAPNKPAPIVWATLFLGSAALHFYQNFRYQSWTFTGLLPFATSIFVAGYIIRAICAWDYGNVGLLIATNICVYIPPPMFELSNYTVLGRILYYVPYHSPLHPGRVLTTFAAISIVVEVLNGQGSSRVFNYGEDQAYRNVGKALLETALILQLIVQGTFILLASYFHRECSRHGIMNNKLKAALLTLYMSWGLITVRTVYRTVEFFALTTINLDDSNAYISPTLRYEWFFWVFEAVPMMCNCWLLNARHPAKYLPRNNKIYLAEDGITEIEGPGYKDRRPWWQSTIDPFDVVGLIKGRDKQERYWETHPRAADPKPEPVED